MTTLKQQQLEKYNFAVSPAVTDDNAKGYLIGDTWVDTTTGIPYICLDNASGAAAWSIINNGGYADNEFEIYNATDNTKEMAFDLSGITTANTRTIKMADRNLDFSGLFAEANAVGVGESPALFTGYPNVDFNVSDPANDVSVVIRSGTDKRTLLIFTDDPTNSAQAGAITYDNNVNKFTISTVDSPAIVIDSSQNIALGSLGANVPAYGVDMWVDTAAIYNEVNAVSSEIKLLFDANNSSNARVNYSYIKSVITDNTAGSHTANLIFSANDRYGFNVPSPLVAYHASKGLPIVQSSAVTSSLDSFLFEADDCNLSLFSSASGSVGSSLSLSEYSGAGALVNKWTFQRQTGTLDNTLALSFGTNISPSSNTSIAEFETNGKTTFNIEENGMYLTRNSSTVSTIGTSIYGVLDNSAGTPTNYARVSTGIGSNAAGGERGTYSIAVSNSGSLSEIIRFDSIAGTNLQFILGAASGTTLLRAGSGHIYYQISSERYKKDIMDSTFDTAKVLELNLRDFKFKDIPTIAPEERNKAKIGFIAEEAWNVSHWFANENEDGMIESLCDPKILYCLVEEVKKLRKEINSLTKVYQIV